MSDCTATTNTPFEGARTVNCVLADGHRGMHEADKSGIDGMTLSWTNFDDPGASTYSSDDDDDWGDDDEW